MDQPVTRTAACACNQLQVTVRGEPRLVNLCNCTYCQKRTGSAFGLSSYFERETQLVSIEGAHTAFGRISQRGRQFEHHFARAAARRGFGTGKWPLA